MKMFIVGVTVLCGVIGGAISVADVSDVQEAPLVEEVPVEYINFTEPLYISGYARNSR